MDTSIDPTLTLPDTILLKHLLQDAQDGKTAGPIGKPDPNDQGTIKLLSDLSDHNSDRFQPTVFTGWDQGDLHFRQFFDVNIYQPYVRWAQTVVRRPTDVVFITHILLYFSTSLPSAIYLFYHFTWPHAVCHWLMTGYYLGPFAILLHNHIHNNGILSKEYRWIDWGFVYILEPLIGHTWDSYYYHHVKHHHTEANGPDDLSSTLRMQRDSIPDFLMYVARFVLLIDIELPLYFIRKGKYKFAAKFLIGEFGNYFAIYLLARWNFWASFVVLITPLAFLRLGIMASNFGQHAFVDENEPDSDFRSSITLIDAPSNRLHFNDGYHTSHHINPRRHWRDHPTAVLKAKDRYQTENALIFHNIDWWGITFRVLAKDYIYLAKRLVPVGPQVDMSIEERAEMLRSKCRKFSEEEIRAKFGIGKVERKIEKTEVKT